MKVRKPNRFYNALRTPQKVKEFFDKGLSNNLILGSHIPFKANYRECNNPESVVQYLLFSALENKNSRHPA